MSSFNCFILCTVWLLMFCYIWCRPAPTFILLFLPYFVCVRNTLHFFVMYYICLPSEYQTLKFDEMAVILPLILLCPPCPPDYFDWWPCSPEPRLSVSFLNLLIWLWTWMYVLSSVWLFATPWTVAHQASLSKEFPRQEYWSGLLFPSPGDLPDPGIEPASPVSPLAGGFFTPEPSGNCTRSCY